MSWDCGRYRSAGLFPHRWNASRAKLDRTSQISDGFKGVRRLLLSSAPKEGCRRDERLRRGIGNPPAYGR